MRRSAGGPLHIFEEAAGKVRAFTLRTLRDYCIAEVGRSTELRNTSKQEDSPMEIRLPELAEISAKLDTIIGLLKQE